MSAVNHVLSSVMQRSECRWISLTTANNAYGSAVVDSVLHSRPLLGHKSQPDILLAPMDSKYFAKQGACVRGVTPFLCNLFFAG